MLGIWVFCDMFDLKCLKLIVLELFFVGMIDLFSGLRKLVLIVCFLLFFIGGGIIWFLWVGWFIVLYFEGIFLVVIVFIFIDFFLLNSVGL